MNQEQQGIREISLQEEEEVWMVLDGKMGLLAEAPPQGECLVLTTQRLLGFCREQGRRRRVLLPLQSVEAVEVSEVAKSPKPLVQGGLLLLAAIVVVWLAVAFNALGVLAWLIVGATVLLAALTASTFFAAEEKAVITFRAHASDLTLSLLTPQAVQGAYSLANDFFLARAGRKDGVGQPAPEEALEPWPDPTEPEWDDGAPLMEAPAHSPESSQPQGRRDV